MTSDDASSTPLPSSTPPATSSDDQAIGPGQAGSVVGAGAGQSPLPFENLQVPAPAIAAPPGGARWLAFGSILIGGLLGGLIGYGTVDVMAGGGLWAPVGGILGAAIGAIGVGIVAGLTLRAMNEWRAVHHPEAGDRPGGRHRGSSSDRSGAVES
jgi:hypothetical protein